MVMELIKVMHNIVKCIDDSDSYDNTTTKRNVMNYNNAGDNY